MEKQVTRILSGEPRGRIPDFLESEWEILELSNSVSKIDYFLSAYASQTGIRYDEWRKGGEEKREKRFHSKEGRR